MQFPEIDAPGAPQPDAAARAGIEEPFDGSAPHPDAHLPGQQFERFAYHVRSPLPRDIFQRADRARDRQLGQRQRRQFQIMPRDTQLAPRKRNAHYGIAVFQNAAVIFHMHPPVAGHFHAGQARIQILGKKIVSQLTQAARSTDSCVRLPSHKPMRAAAVICRRAAHTDKGMKLCLWRDVHETPLFARSRGARFVFRPDFRRGRSP